MISFKDYSLALKYHVINNIPLSDNVFRYGSESYFNLINEIRKYKEELNLTESEKEILNSDIGTFGLYEGKEVPLDLPFIEEEQVAEEKEPELNKPKRSTGPKKYYVYVKNDKGNIIKINFGDVKGGLTAKINDPEARKSFVARHDCENKKDKTKPGYWACRLPFYAKSLGLSGGGNFFW